MRCYLSFWESLTNDPVILDAIKYHHIEFETEYPTQTVQPNKFNFSAAEIMIIDAEIAKLVSKEVLQVTNCVTDGFISNIFIRPKKDGAFRTILNLKPLISLSIITISKSTHSVLLSSLFDLYALWHL